MKDEKTIVINIDLTQGLVTLLALALLVAALLGYLAWSQGEAAASGPQAPLDHPFDLAQSKARDRPLASSTGMRQYYLTTSTYNGAEADGTDGNGAGVCADGYHFASLWEILDPSNLKYNTTLGRTQSDSGQGPPSLSQGQGWVRTGYGSSHGNTPGLANCRAWTSSSRDDYGTSAFLDGEWTAEQDIHVWEAHSSWCIWSGPVWCVED